MKIDWKKGVGFGALLWVVVFIFVCIFVAYKVPTDVLWSHIVFVILTAVVVYILAGFVKPTSIKEALKYGITWAVVGIILDLLISRMFAPGMFASLYYWISYALVVLVPLLRVKKAFGQTGPTTVDPA